VTLAAEHVAVRLGGAQVLAGVSAVFARGQVTAVLGPNGAGKSTLLACLAGLRRPDAGRARLEGRDVLSLAPRARARRIAFLPQTPEIAWAVTARTLVGLGRTPFTGARGLSASDQAAVDRALGVAGVERFAERDVTSLSGGERARVLIARALAGEPDWLLADEPLTGLDPGHQLDVAALFRSLAAEGRGVIVTLHDLQLAMRLADRVLVIAAGELVADGAPGEAITPRVLREVYGVEAKLTSGIVGPRVEIIGRS
jgi:iron complex transport system ATP-binding protein